MIDLSNIDRRDCQYYVYLTLDLRPKHRGKFYIGKHKAKKAGVKDEHYYGSCSELVYTTAVYGIDYVRKNFKNIVLWWAKDNEEALMVEHTLIDYYEAIDLGWNSSNNNDKFTLRKLSEPLLNNDKVKKCIERRRLASKKYRESHKESMKRRYEDYMDDSEKHAKRCKYWSEYYFRHKQEANKRRTENRRKKKLQK